jgi:hypothetical protein
VKRLLALLAGAFGLRALLRRRPRPAFPQGASPADELRTRLAEARIAPEAAVVETSRVEPEPEPTSTEPASVEDRRADVHNRARGAIDELKS